MEVPVIQVSVVTDAVTKRVQDVFNTTDAAAEETLRQCLSESLYGKYDESIRKDHLQVALRIGTAAAALITCPTVGAVNRSHADPSQRKVFKLDIYIIGENVAKIQDSLEIDDIKACLVLATSRYFQINNIQTLSDVFVLEVVVATVEQIHLAQALNSPKDLLVLNKGYSAALEKLKGNCNSQLLDQQAAQNIQAYLKVVEEEIQERLQFVNRLIGIQSKNIFPIKSFWLETFIVLVTVLLFAALMFYAGFVVGRYPDLLN